MAESRWSDMNTPLVVTIGLIGAILLFGVAVPGLQALAITLENQHQARQEGGQSAIDRTEQVRRIRTNTPRWIDQPNGVVAIDIERAMRLYAERQQVAPTPTPEDRADEAAAPSAEADESASP